MFRISLLKFLCLIFLGIYPFLAFGQIKGKITLADNATISLPKTIYLSTYKGGELITADSTSLRFDLSFSFPANKITTDGVFEIKIGNEKPLPLILTKKDSVILIPIVLDESEMRITPFNFESKAFAEFNSILRSFIKNSNKVLAQRNKIEYLHEQHTESGQHKLKTLKISFDSLQFDFNKKLNALRKTSAGSYASEVLAQIIYIAHADAFNSKSEHYQSSSWVLAHFLDSVPFHDEKMISNPIFEEKLLSYISMYPHNEIEDLKKALDHLIGLCSKNAAVKESAITILTNYFLEKGPEAMVTYIHDNYIDGCSSSLPAVTLKRIKQLKDFKPGMKAPDIRSFTPDGKEISLYSTLSGNPVLVYFWASWCGHCKQETPNYISIFKEYRSKGFKVFAVSLDSDKADWIKEINNLKSDWLNVSDLKGFDSEAANSYYVYKTPSMFLLDKDGNLISKEITVPELKTQLNFLLK